MTPNKLYLFYPTSFIGFLICLVTRTRWAHAAVEVDGVMYDASESRGNFALSDIDPAKRRHLAFDFYGDLDGWLAVMLGRKYDYWGVLGWVFGANNPDKVYCFEAAFDALRACGVELPRDGKGVFIAKPGNISGHYLMLMMLGYSAERARGDIVYGVAWRVAQCLGLSTKDLRRRLSGPTMEVLFIKLDALRMASGCGSFLFLVRSKPEAEDVRDIVRGVCPRAFKPPARASPPGDE